MLYDSNCMTFRKRQNYGDDKKTSGGQECVEGEEMNSQSTKNFKGNENTPYDIKMMEFVQSHRMYNTQREP